jgi:tetratricopeptide (TPR) repeat protein
VAFEPLVNLGGVLLKKNAPVDALLFNQRAVEGRPKDALANAQLGMTYFQLQDFDRAEQYLLEAQRLDPAQFSQPQLFLAEIYARRGNRSAAIRELEDLLAIRPDGPLSDRIRSNLAQLVQ